MGQILEHLIGGSVLLSKGGSLQVSANPKKDIEGPRTQKNPFGLEVSVI